MTNDLQLHEESRRVEPRSEFTGMNTIGVFSLLTTEPTRQKNQRGGGLRRRKPSVWLQDPRESSCLALQLLRALAVPAKI